MSDHDSLFTSFTDLVNRFTHHRGQIAKAEALSDRFRAEVIGVVVDDHTSRSMDLVGDIMASLFEVESAVEGMKSNREEVSSGAGTQRTQMEELELNLMIEAITQEEFDQQAAALKEALTKVDSQIAALDTDLERFDGVLAQWNEIGSAAGVLQA